MDKLNEAFDDYHMASEEFIDAGEDRVLDGGDSYSAKNLQLLCAEHHRLKTGLENRERRVDSE